MDNSWINIWKTRRKERIILCIVLSLFFISLTCSFGALATNLNDKKFIKTIFLVFSFVCMPIGIFFLFAHLAGFKIKTLQINDFSILIFFSFKTHVIIDGKETKFEKKFLKHTIHFSLPNDSKVNLKFYRGGNFNYELEK